MPRQHVYLTEKELELAHRRAADEGVSLSYLFRVGLRQLIGLPIPRAFRRAWQDDELPRSPDSAVRG